MKLNFRLFAGLRQRAGATDIAIVVDDDSMRIAAALDALVQEVPALAGALDSAACAVNDEIVGADYEVRSGMTIALLPPVSGGSDRWRPWLSPKPLNRQALIAETADPACGGLVVFSGDIRHHNGDRDDVVAIEYEAHQSMAAQVLEAIEGEVIQGFDVRQCRIQHRLGRVSVGEASVLVVCRAAHRAAAFEGARYAIDELKARTPIWKREFYGDGHSRYLDGTPLKTPE